VIGEAPVFGIGPGRFAVRSEVRNGEEVSYAHNEFLQLTAELGVPGALLLLAILSWVLMQLWRASPDPRVLPVAVALTAITLNANIDFLWHSPGVLLALAALSGAATGIRNPGGEAVADPKLKGSGWVILVTAVLFALTWVPSPNINPPVTTLNEAGPAPGSAGIRFTGVGGLISETAPAELYERLTSSQELSLEMVVTSARVDQVGPARLVTLSDSVLHRNLTVGQEADSLILRLRTTATNRNATDAEIAVPGIFRAGQAQRLLIATDADEVRVFVDGDLRWRGSGPGGRLDNWNHSYSLVVGNEATGDRGWRGVMHFLAIFDESLDAERLGSHARHDRTAVAGPDPMALYVFDQPIGSRVPDRSAVLRRTDLALPDRFRSPTPSYVDVLRDAGGVWSARIAGSAVLFMAWGAAVWSFAFGRWQRTCRLAALVGGVGVVVAVLTSVFRYLAGRAPSLFDLVGAALGLALVLALCSVRAHRRSP
jgi:hypothetical protein